MKKFLVITALVLAAMLAGCAEAASEDTTVADSTTASTEAETTEAVTADSETTAAPETAAEATESTNAAEAMLTENMIKGYYTIKDGKIEITDTNFTTVETEELIAAGHKMSFDENGFLEYFTKDLKPIYHRGLLNVSKLADGTYIAQTDRLNQFFDDGVPKALIFDTDGNIVWESDSDRRCMLVSSDIMLMYDADGIVRLYSTDNKLLCEFPDWKESYTYYDVEYNPFEGYGTFGYYFVTEDKSDRKFTTEDTESIVPGYHFREFFYIPETEESGMTDLGYLYITYLGTNRTSLDKELTEVEIMKLYNDAAEVYTDMHMGTLPVIFDRSLEKDGYFPIRDYETLADLKAYLGEYFTDNLIDRMVGGYKDIDGRLYGIPADRGEDIGCEITGIEYEYLNSQTVIVRRYVRGMYGEMHDHYSQTNEHHRFFIEYTAECEPFEFPLVKEDGKWLFTSMRANDKRGEITETAIQELALAFIAKHKEIFDQTEPSTGIRYFSAYITKYSENDDGTYSLTVEINEPVDGVDYFCSIDYTARRNENGELYFGDDFVLPELIFLEQIA